MLRLILMLVVSLVGSVVVALAQEAPAAPTPPLPSLSEPIRPRVDPQRVEVAKPIEPKLPRPTQSSLGLATVITSDELSMDNDKKIAVFTGHVKVVDPQATMTAEKMVVYMTQKDASLAAPKEPGKPPTKETDPAAAPAPNPNGGSGIKRIEATGGVVIAQEGSRAIADEAVYNASDHTVVLSGAAQVQNDQGIVTGETVYYDMEKQTAQVKGRPRMTILPSQNQGAGGAPRQGLFPIPMGAKPKTQSQPASASQPSAQPAAQPQPQPQPPTKQ